MSKTSAKANPVNQDAGDRNRGSEPGQEQQTERHDRQNMAQGRGTQVQGQNQGRALGAGQSRDKRSEKGDARRTPNR